MLRLGQPIDRRWFEMRRSWCRADRLDRPHPALARGNPDLGVDGASDHAPDRRVAPLGLRLEATPLVRGHEDLESLLQHVHIIHKWLRTAWFAARATLTEPDLVGKVAPRNIAPSAPGVGERGA